MQSGDRPARILVVEDFVPLARAITRVLSLCGAQAIVAHSVRAARTIIATAGADDLVTEALLADGCGVELAETMRHMCPDARVVVIAGGPVDVARVVSPPLRGTLLIKPFATLRLAGALWPKYPGEGPQ